MGDKKRRFTAEFKTKVVLEALRSPQTIHEIASKHGVHRNQVMTWKNQAEHSLHALFELGRGDQQEEDQEELMARLSQQINQLKVELDRLEKKLAPNPEQKQAQV